MVDRNKKQHFMLLTGNVVFVPTKETAGDSPLTLQINAVRRSDTDKLTLHELRASQQILQMQALSKVDGVLDMTEFKIGDVVILNRVPMGFMSENEFDPTTAGTWQ